MISKYFYIFLFAISAIWLSGCSVSKKLPAGESLYKGAEVKINADSSMSKKEAASVKSQLETIVRPKPNNAILGFPYKVWLYYLFGEPTKETGFKNWFRKKFGEPPVFANRRIIGANSQQIAVYLNNEGYFLSSASGELKENKREAKALYSVSLKPRFYLDTIVYDNPDTTAITKAIIASSRFSLLKKGQPYQFSVIKEERERIDQTLKRRGFYFFRPEYIILKADTNNTRRKVNLSIEIKPNVTEVAKKVYSIRDIHVMTDYGNNTADTLESNYINYGGMKILDPRSSYKPKIFTEAIGFRRGSRYSSNVHDVSLSRLINLKNFKFVRNRFDLVPRSDSALIDVYYYLTPLKGKSLQTEVSGVTKSNDLTGTQLALIWKNRNAFKGAEMLSFSVNGGLDFQLGNSQTAINTRRLTFEGNLSVPRFLLPFIRINPRRNQALPSTNINVTYEKLIKGNLYDLTSLRTSMSYSWKQNASIEHTITPVSINLVKANVNEDFIEQIFLYPQLISILDNQLITSSGYNFGYVSNSRRNSRQNLSFTGGVEVAGNLAGLLSPKDPNNSNTGLILGVQYAQYARFDADFRYRYNMSPTITWANRIMTGFGIPYGNSNTLPYLKQYVAGGSNSIRAFQSRTIGPGDYHDSSGSEAQKFIANQTGDIKIELNTELRAKFSSIINGAIFVDAGNVWMYKYADNYGEGSIFGKDFLKQMAVGAGIGLRLDFTYLVLRLDLATPLRKPYLPENERWVINKIDFGSSDWRKENLVLNIAFGYPF